MHEYLLSSPLHFIIQPPATAEVFSLDTVLFDRRSRIDRLPTCTNSVSTHDVAENSWHCVCCLGSNYN
jgi:hypothetical protein